MKLYGVSEGNSLRHGQETHACGDAGYQGAERRPGKRRALNKDTAVDAAVAKIEKIKASIRVKAEHPFRVVKSGSKATQQAADTASS